MMKREPDAEVISNIITQVRPDIFDYLENEIGDKTYLVGGAFSIADIAVNCQFIQMMYSGEALPKDTHPKITRFVEHHMRRDSFKQWIIKDGFITLD